MTAGAKNHADVPGEVTDFLRNVLGDDWTIEALHGDASVRRYFRVRTRRESYIVGYYPEAVRESLERFLRAHDALSGGRRVPPIIQHAAAVVLQHDVGDRTLFDILRSDREAAIPLYREAIALLVEFQNAAHPAREINPPFDARKFEDELRMTGEFYVERLCGTEFRPELERIFSTIAADLVTHPYVLCHRDYHGENIHVVNGELYVIDFQDLRMGPDTYDLASLLRDRGAGSILGEALERDLLQEYAARIGAGPEIESRYFRNLLQRSIKAIGTFAKQAVTRGRLHYLDYITPTLEAVDLSIRNLPEYGELRKLFPMSFDPASVREKENS